MDSRVEGQPSANREIILDVGGNLVPETVLFLAVGVCRVCHHLTIVILFLHCGVGFRDVGVVDIFTAEFDEVSRSRGVVKVNLGGDVLYSGTIVELVRIV